MPARRFPASRTWVNAALAVVVAAAVLFAAGGGLAPALPALGPVLEPGTGLWQAARAAVLPQTELLRLGGLTSPVEVAFSPAGVPTIVAPSSDAAFLAEGYLAGRNRLLEMDLLRRQGEGLLSEVLGPSALASDRLERTLGLERTAAALWASLPPESATRRALLAYSRGVNEAIAAVEAAHELPVAMRLLGYQPAPWTPIDSLVIQGDLTQELDFSTAPADMAVLERTIGPARTAAWFPVVSPVAQAPYDPGPYRRLPPAPLPGRIPDSTPLPVVGRPPAPPGAALLAAVTGGRPPSSGGSARSGPAGASAVVAASGPAGASDGSPFSLADPGRLESRRAARNASLAWLAALPAEVHRYPDSNNWAVAPARTAGGRAILAGDPHLPQTIPSLWYELSIEAPSLAVAGVIVPGLPGVLLGRTKHLAWSLTDTQNQSTLLYRMLVDPTQPDLYWWRGAWRRMRVIDESIPVAGEPAARLSVRVTADGPLLAIDGSTYAVWWAGAIPSSDIAALLRLYQARDGAEVRQALRGWLSPTQNFAYADSRGGIGIVAPGIYPLVASGKPWLPLVGTGGEDVVGTIPDAAVPQVANPPGGFVWSANQRPVTASYPYFIGTTADMFSPGFRATVIRDFLAQDLRATVRSMERLQTSVRDELASVLVPRLVGALRSGPTLTGDAATAAALVQHWDDAMRGASPAAAIWWTFLNDYLQDTFGPWWTADHVPQRRDGDLAISPEQSSLVEDLQAWTVSDPTNPAFSLPDGRRRTAGEVMRLAFGQAVAYLAHRLGGSPAGWAWRRIHTRELPSLTGAAALGYGPFGSGGDAWTVNAADGNFSSSAGPSWRMIVSFAGGSVGIYPGGQSENPASPWYESFVVDFVRGRYLPLPIPGAPPPSGSSVEARWRLVGAGG